MRIIRHSFPSSFNSQPPGGGWSSAVIPLPIRFRFNSQPPGGGWAKRSRSRPRSALFQLTAARRRLAPHSAESFAGAHAFQLTAARRRLDAPRCQPACACAVSTHSRPEAAGKAEALDRIAFAVSTHSRPEAAGSL